MGKAQRHNVARRAIGASGAVVVVFALVALALRIAGDDDPTTPVALADVLRTGDAAGFNILLITLDTTRPDRLGCYGYKQAKTAAIDSLLDHGVRFDDAVTSAPTTLPSHATMLTGRYPPAIGVRENGTYRLVEEHVTLAEILSSNGYDTAAFVSAFVLDQRFGLDQGFDLYDFKISEEGRTGGPASLRNERQANYVTTPAIQWLKARHNSGAAAPFFMWIHYYDPHAPYTSPLADVQGLASRPYDAEIAFVDLHLKRLLEAVDELGLRGRTLIVLVSDHGEGLREHGESTHGVFVYESTLRVGLVLSCPTLFDRAYRVDDRAVGTVDILPTVLDLLGLPAAGSTDGRSLLAPGAAPDRAIYVESNPIHEGCHEIRGLRRHVDKFILAPRPEYYDLRRDGREQQNLYAGGPPELAALAQQLAELTSAWDEGGQAQAGARLLSPDEEAKLRALGYLVRSDLAGPDSLPDCKDQIGLISQIGELEMLITQEKYEECVELAREMMDQSPGYEAAVLKLADCLIQLGREEEASEVLREYATNYPSPGSLYYYARSLFRLGRYDECLKQLDAAEALNPGFGVVPVLRGDYFFIMERWQEGIEQYERAIEIDGERLGPEVPERLQEARKRLRQTEPRP